MRAAGFALAAGLCALAAAAPAAAERPVAVIVSASWNGIEAVSLPLLRELWLGRRSQLAGERIECFDLPSGSELRRAFGDAVLGKSERTLEEYWIRQALTGGNLPPRELGSAAEVVRAVARRRGAIGYVDLGELRALRDPAVRVLPLLVDGRPLLPGSAGYPIRRPGEPEADAPVPAVTPAPPRPPS